jgi:hypothetical protein
MYKMTNVMRYTHYANYKSIQKECIFRTRMSDDGKRYPCCERCIYHETESFKFGIDWTETAKWTKPCEVPCDYCRVERSYFIESKEAMG